MAELNIDGMTSLYALAGQHIGFSPLPGHFNTIASFIGYNSVMFPFDTSHHDIHMVLDALQILKCKGIFIDTPHRCGLDDLLVSRSEEARNCEAVNVIRIDSTGLHGHNTEISAFRKAFPIITDTELSGRKIFLIGGGGIAKAVAMACALEQCESLTIVNRTTDKARRICDSINSKFGEIAFAADMNEAGTIHSFYNAEIIIQATSIGMFPQVNTNPLPEGFNILPHHLVMDAIYHPPQTRLMQLAEEKGCNVFNGRDIMFFSCLEAFQWWTDVKIDNESEKKLFNIWKELIYNI